MITNREIVNTYLTYRNMILSDDGHRDDVRMMMPFYLMDASYQIYCQYVKDFVCKHKVKAAKNRWKEAYRQFNSEFFRAFNPDQQEFITDQMDEFESFINNKVVILLSTVMGVFSTEASFEEKKILAAVLTSNALAQMAQYVYRDMYRGYRHQKINNPHIDSVIKNSYEFARNFPVSRGVDLTSSDKVSAMINSLCKEAMRFINMKFNEAAN